MQRSVASAINSLYQSIVIVCIALSVKTKSQLRKLENGLKNTEIKKGISVTIVKQKVIAPQQFFLPFPMHWYTLSFHRINKDLTVTILTKKLEIVQL